MLETILATVPFTIEHDSMARCLQITWRGPQTAEGTEARCARLLQEVQRTHVHYLLNDSSESLDGWHEVGRWLETEYFPLLADHGIRAVAWVNAQDWPARTATSEVLSHTTRPVVDTFEDVEAAHTWLAALQ